jgi:hypothetical protein
MYRFFIALMMVGLSYAQQPIIRIMQSREYNTPKTWWREATTFNLRGYLADDTTGMSTANGASGVALYNNNFDAWRDSVMTLAVTLDDKDADITTFRIDLVFDNDLITWGHDSTRIQKGSYLSGFTEGDSTANADYSYEVVWYENVGYVDSLQTANQEISEGNTRYDWLRITMVSHNGNSFTFGNGNNVQTELLKIHLKINDVVDNFQPQSFRIPTFYNGVAGYYTYVSDGYLLDFKVYIDGNYGTEETYDGGARGDITLHPKLMDIEGYFRYIGRNGINNDNTYPYWKIKFELDQTNPDNNENWYNLETVDNVSGNSDEDLSDDVVGDHISTVWYNEQGTSALQPVPGEGFLGISYYDSTYVDDRGYFNIQLPRNNYYRLSFYPPDDADDIGNHNQLELDRYGITNINDAIASFNFQSNKFYSVLGVDTLNPVGYLIGDVDGDDLFQLNDTYFLWAYVSGIFDNYTHLNGNSYENWSTIDTLRENNQPFPYVWYEDWGNQKYEFTVFRDDDLDEENAGLNFGFVEVINPLMNDIQTGLDTIGISIGEASSEWMSEVNPDTTLDSLSYFFTGDINVSGTKVKETDFSVGTDFDVPTPESQDGYINVNGSTFYRWGEGDPPNTWAAKTATNHFDVELSFPSDSTVRVQSGNQIEVPLMISPKEGNKVAGFEFQVEFNEQELKFLDMKTGTLPGPWMSYTRVHEPSKGWRRVSFGALDYSPGNASDTYWIENDMVGLSLLFEAEFPPTEWTEAPIRFVGKNAAGNQSGDDLLMRRMDGQVLVWNKYWAFGGGEPTNDEITYNYPNPFRDFTTFQFYLDQTENAKVYILNSVGQYMGTIFDEIVVEGLHTFAFTNQPADFLPEVSVKQGWKSLEPGVYIFVLQTEKKIRSSKFTVIK